MDNRFPLWEKVLYRAVNTVFLVSIAIFVAGRYLGIVSTNIVHGIIAMIVLIALTAIGNCSKKGKLFSILCLVGVGISVIIVIGMEHILRFLFSYGRWFIGKGTWEKEWLIGYELMQVVWIVLFCYGLQVLLEKIFTIKLVIAGVMVIYLVILFFLEEQLARTLGIPARYVQGYCIPLGEEETTIVTSSFAHAWPEVYIEHIGWIPFEPTPGYGEIRYTPWATKKGQKEPTREELWKEQVKDSMIQEKKEEQEELSLEFLDKLEEKREQQKKGYKKQLMRIVLSSICFTLITGILILFLERLIRWYHYQKMNVEQKYLVQVKRNLKLLSKLGLVRKEEETIEEFEKRIRMELSEEYKFYFLEIYEKFLYGTFEIDEESIQLVLQEQEKLLQIFCCFNLFFDKINKIRKGVDL